MAQETSTFDCWLEAVEEAARGHGLAASFDVVARRAEQAFGARLRFVTVLGRRRAYLAGHRSQTPSAELLEHVALGRQVEMVVESWGTLSGYTRQRLVAFLKDGLIALEQQP